MCVVGSAEPLAPFFFILSNLDAARFRKINMQMHDTKLKEVNMRVNTGLPHGESSNFKSLSGTSPAALIGFDIVRSRSG